jgi:phosphomannomutase
MDISPGIFKAYDIRGLAPEQVTEEVAYRVGQGIVRLTGAATIVVGHDMRATSPQLAAAMMDGITSLGADAVSIGGRVTTPMVYFATGADGAIGAGVMITASHNPSQYNGIKMCYGDVTPIGAETGIFDLRDMVLAGRVPAAATRGSVREIDIRQAYFAKLLSLVDVTKLKELSVVADTANGMEGAIIEELFARLPSCSLHGMYLELDGDFPNHEANPLKTETLAALCAEVVARRADLGVAFDGDGDRIGLVDEKGVPVSGDAMLALIAPTLLRAHPGASMTYDVRCGMVAQEEIAKAGGKPLMTKVGHGLIKPFMRREGAVFGGELAQHFYFKEFFTADATDYMMLLVFQLLTETGKPLSELVAPLRRYHHSGEINSEVEDKSGVIAALRETYGALPGATVSDIDGVRVELRDTDGVFLWWFNVRASNTEPLLRLCLEARTKELMEEKRDELLVRIRSRVAHRV